MEVGDGLHLTYCTNIHPAIGWEAVQESLRAHAPALKARLSPDAPFGIGLRLSGAESSELLEGDRLARFRGWLDAEGLYVFTINGFPHGTFHGRPVKADVHAPDWRTEERVAYTLRLAEILDGLLPDAVDGTISTSPLSYRPWLGDGDEERCTANVVRVADALRGTRIALAIEPEPDGALADIDDLVRWWDDRLDRDHVTVCFDACHAAVAYEEPGAALDALDAAGIRVGKAQLSAALQVAGDGAAELARFADPIYLHQVSQRSADGTLATWPDLPEALPALGDGECRVHFHVPIFVERYGALESTQDHLRATIEHVRDRTAHLEIETYTWDVLPTGLKASSVDSIAREYEWVLGVLG
ncbi:MAG TPA: metabolite traffic protein EboE [Solirubrobacteraceae bacterium]|nr:metabolite traffic protein EboE [Solirubrobacteraceae bacterium]